MRPAEEQAGLSAFAQASEGVIHVVVTALDSSDRFANFLELAASVVGPDLETTDLALEQTAPGRYVGQFPAPRAGTYLLSIRTPTGRATIRTGVNVPYSAEFNQQVTDIHLLRSLAALEPRGGQRGAVIAEPIGDAGESQAGRVNVFRHDLAPATSRETIWPALVFAAACLFFVDVFNRRVAFSLKSVRLAAGRMRDRLFTRSGEIEQELSIERLRTRKTEVGEQIVRRRAVVSMEEDAGDTLERGHHAVATQTLEANAADATSEPSSRPEVDEDYTARLLRAKQRVWQARKGPQGEEP
jgi:hypothetical protein